MKTALRGLGVADTVNDAITGHAAKSVGASYGGVELATKKAAIDAGAVIVMDNATFHKRADMLTAIKEHGCIAEFLPPYSPRAGSHFVNEYDLIGSNP